MDNKAEKNPEPETQQIKRTRAQRIAAIIGVCILAALYLTALISAFFDSPLACSVLMAAIFCTIVIPVFIYLFGKAAKWFSGKQEPKEEDQKK